MVRREPSADLVLPETGLLRETVLHVGELSLSRVVVDLPGYLDHCH
jgi:hypothetical protein